MLVIPIHRPSPAVILFSFAVHRNAKCFATDYSSALGRSANGKLARGWRSFFYRSGRRKRGNMKKEGNSKNLEISCLTSTACLIKVEKLSGLKPSGRARKREVGVIVGTILIWFTKG